MPDHPRWLDRVPEILRQLQTDSTPPILDRTAIERLFGIRRRQAITLLHRFSGYKLGRTFVVHRDSVVQYLTEVAKTGEIAAMEEQQRTVAEFLGEARQGLLLPCIPIPRTKLSEITFAGLPPGIHLIPGQLTIEFSGAQNLLEKLFVLSQALANDFPTLEAALGEKS